MTPFCVEMPKINIKALKLAQKHLKFALTGRQSWRVFPSLRGCSKCDAVDVHHHHHHHHLYVHHPRHHHHYLCHHQKQENLKIKVTTLHGYRYLAKGGLSTLIWFYK